MKKLIFATITSLLLIACKSEIKKSKPTQLDNTPSITTLSIPEKIAKANGFDHWNTVKEIQFAFNVDRGTRKYTRLWKWNPTSDEVTSISNGDTIRYNRKSIDSTALKADQGFINDSYWLLTPFNLVWDKGITFSSEKNAIAPISKKNLDKLTIVYSDKGGYTPGDAYDFYYDANFIIQEWVFRQGNQDSASLSTTWEDYQEFNGIKLSLSRKTADEKFHLFFTDIKITQ